MFKTFRSGYEVAIAHNPLRNGNGALTSYDVIGFDDIYVRH
jgi:hypothetical protein